MYFAKLFRTHFSKQLYFLTLLDSFFRKLVSSNVSSRYFVKCFQLSSKHFAQYFQILEFIWTWFFSQVQVVCKNDAHASFVCVYVALFGYFFHEKSEKVSGVIIVCSGWGKVSFIFTWKRGLEVPLKRPSGWLCGILQSRSKPSLALDVTCIMHPFINWPHKFTSYITS